MTSRVFLAGATGVIGRRLVPLLRKAGYQVFGMTRRADEGAQSLRAAGATPVVVDVYDAPALSAAIETIRPEIVIHQLTDLPSGLDPVRMNEAIRRNARIRSEGTLHLVRAAVAAGSRRIVAQSIAWAYAPGPEPYTEDAPLDLGADGNRAVTVEGIVDLEERVLDTPEIQGVVLRYGHLYGPKTGSEKPAGVVDLHVDAAAQSAVLGIGVAPGIYNIAEPGGNVSIDKARGVFGWDPDFRIQ